METMLLPVQRVTARIYIMTSYIFDTSAIRGTSGSVLEKAAGRHDLRMSPWSFWELVCHLDESLKKVVDEEERFRRQRGQVLKCRHLGVLDEPFAEHAVVVGAGGLVNETRFDDRLIVEQILAALDGSSSQEEFYERTVSYPTGEKGRLEDLAANVRSELDVEESRYVKHVLELANKLDGAFGLTGLRGLSHDDYVQAVVTPCRNLTEQYASEGVADPILLGRVIDSLYLHMAYKFGRARSYLLRAGAVAKIVADPNDFEDGAIALHIGLSGNRVLVTGDTGTMTALDDGLTALAQSSKRKGVSVPISCRVIGPVEFAREVA